MIGACSSNLGCAPSVLFVPASPPAAVASSAPAVRCSWPALSNSSCCSGSFTIVSLTSPRRVCSFRCAVFRHWITAILLPTPACVSSINSRTVGACISDRTCSICCLSSTVSACFAFVWHRRCAATLHYLVRRPWCPSPRRRRSRRSASSPPPLRRGARLHLLLVVPVAVVTPRHRVHGVHHVRSKRNARRALNRGFYTKISMNTP